MTLQEQVGQLFILGFDGTGVIQPLRRFLREFRPGGMILFARNLDSPVQVAHLTNDLQAAVPDGPLLMAIDQEGGRVSRLPAGFTVFPASGVLGQGDASELAYAAAAATAAELRAVGINLNTAPVLDVNSNPQNPIIGDRAFSGDPQRVSDLGLATMAGLQHHGVIACGKHFPGHGDTTADSHRELPIVTASDAQLRQRELPPFQAAIAHGLATLMTAHVRYPAWDTANPATWSRPILTDLLRTELGFAGPVVSDDLEMRAILDHADIGEGAVRAVEAGCDLLLVCHEQGRQVQARDAVVRAVQEGRISRQRLGDSLQRIQTVKAKYLRHPARVEPDRVTEVVGHRAHAILLARMRRIADSHRNLTA